MVGNMKHVMAVLLFLVTNGYFVHKLHRMELRAACTEALSVETAHRFALYANKNAKLVAPLRGWEAHRIKACNKYYNTVK